MDTEEQFQPNYKFEYTLPEQCNPELPLKEAEMSNNVKTKHPGPSFPNNFSGVFEGNFPNHLVEKNSQDVETNHWVYNHVGRVFKFARNANYPRFTLAILKAIYSASSLKTFLFQVRDFIQFEIERSNPRIPEKWDFPIELKNIGGISQQRALYFLEQTKLWDAYIVYLNYGHLKNNGNGISRKVKREILDWVCGIQRNNNKLAPNKNNNIDRYSKNRSNGNNNFNPGFQPIKIDNNVSAVQKSVYTRRNQTTKTPVDYNSTKSLIPKPVEEKLHSFQPKIEVKIQEVKTETPKKEIPKKEFAKDKQSIKFSSAIPTVPQPQRKSKVVVKRRKIVSQPAAKTTNKV